MNNPLRAGVVGLTGIGANRPAPGPGPGTGFEMPHSHVGAYHHVAGTEPVAVCDIVPEKLDDFHRTWGDVLPDVRGYTDYREMLDREQLDVISVATPDDRHAQIVVDAVDAGVRGIVCEKPIASTLADADRMIAAVEAAGVPMLVDHTRRWMFPWVQVAEVIASGEIGEVQRIVANQGGPRAMLFRNGTHMFDTILWFAGGTPTAVYAIAEAGFENYPPRYSSDGGHDPDTDPAMSVVVEFDNGVRAFWNMCKTMPQVFSLEVLGTAGIARVDDSGNANVVVKNGVDFKQRNLPRPQFTLGHIAGCVDEMVQLIHHGGRPSMDGRTSRQVVEVLLAALHSQHAGNARITLPISDA
ncbi:MAG: Gfo/Idh/MocA family oxidoreductase [Chloroflexi bacterium]|nr:Gfo/Idh/MocA family oxidoreductase [Chloroflexota bacterium]